MGKIVITEFISLDGVIEDPGGSEDYKHGGWSFEIERGEEGDKFKLDETLDSEALLLGRRTYEGFADGVAVEGRRVRRQVQQHAEVRGLLDAEGPGVDQLDGDRQRPGRGGLAAEGRSSTATSWSTAAPSSCRRSWSRAWWTSCA